MNWEETNPHWTKTVPCIKGVAWVGGRPHGPFMLRIYETNRFISVVCYHDLGHKGGASTFLPHIKTVIGSNNPRSLKFDTFEEACEARDKVFEISKDKTAIESCSNYDLEEAASGWAIENYAEPETKAPRENPQAQGIFSVYPASTTMNWYNNGNKAVPVYAVHKSGPRDSQTKFLVYNNEWLWVWASYFTPIAQ